MANYQLAGLVVDIRNRYPYLQRQCKDFLCPEDCKPDISVAVSDEEIRQEQEKTGNRFPNGYVESICAYRKLCLEMPRFSGMFLHASVVRAEDKGIAFLAPSGTGKTTHTALWQNLLGDALTVVNGDKPIVRMIEGKAVAYGTPWAGKEGLFQKDSAALTDLCFLERAKENSCSPLSPQDALMKIIHQVILPQEERTAIQTLDLLDQLLRSCRLWQIRCNMDLQAASTAYSAIFQK